MKHVKTDLIEQVINNQSIADKLEIIEAKAKVRTKLILKNIYSKLPYYIEDNFENSTGANYGIKEHFITHDDCEYEVRVWNVSLSRWMYLETKDSYDEGVELIKQLNK